MYAFFCATNKVIFCWHPSHASTKRWICCEDDLAALYTSYEAYPGKQILLWCEGCSSEESVKPQAVSGGRKRVALEKI